jgi:uncharacterized glyoxalase superfamily protein PhnB
MTNRSVPVDTVLPHVVYHDVAGAIDWLGKTFGFLEHYRYGDPVAGAQMSLGAVYVMISVARDDRDSPARLGRWTQSLTIFVDDVDTHYCATKSAGVKIVEDLQETIYGKRLTAWRTQRATAGCFRSTYAMPIRLNGEPRSLPGDLHRLRPLTRCGIGDAGGDLRAGVGRRGAQRKIPGRTGGGAARGSTAELHAHLDALLSQIHG